MFDDDECAAEDHYPKTTYDSYIIVKKTKIAIPPEFTSNVAGISGNAFLKKN